MSPYENSKPRFVRDWYLKLKAIMKANKVKREAEEAKLAVEGDVGSPNANSPVKAIGKEDEQPQVEVPDDFSDKSINYQDEYENDFADKIEYSEDESDEEGNGLTLKGAAQYM
jgi:hypothetical protein